MMGASHHFLFSILEDHVNRHFHAPVGFVLLDRWSDSRKVMTGGAVVTMLDPVLVQHLDRRLQFPP